MNPFDKNAQKDVIEKIKRNLKKNINISRFLILLSALSIVSSLESKEPEKTDKTTPSPTALKDNKYDVRLNLFFFLNAFLISIGLHHKRKLKKALQLVTVSLDGRKTVEDSLLSTLTYGTQNQKTFAYRSLTESDLKRFCRFFDFSTLSSDQQKETLQIILDISEKEPFIRAFIRQPIPYVFARFDGKGLKDDSNGECVYKMFYNLPLLIPLCTFRNLISQDKISFFHEVRHVHQKNEGLYSFHPNRVPALVDILLEADAFGYNSIIESHSKQNKATKNGMCLAPQYTSFFMELFTRKNKQKLETTPELQAELGLISLPEGQQKKLIDVAARALAFENTKGVIMRLCLEESREKCQSFLFSLLKKAHLEKLITVREANQFLENSPDLYEPILKWRSLYLYPPSSEFNLYNHPLTDSEQKDFAPYKQYYTEKTGTSFNDLKISWTPQDTMLFIQYSIKEQPTNIKEVKESITSVIKNFSPNFIREGIQKD